MKTVAALACTLGLTLMLACDEDSAGGSDTITDLTFQVIEVECPSGYVGYLVVGTVDDVDKVAIVEGVSRKDFGTDHNAFYGDTQVNIVAGDGTSSANINGEVVEFDIRAGDVVVSCPDVTGGARQTVRVVIGLMP